MLSTIGVKNMKKIIVLLLCLALMPLPVFAETEGPATVEIGGKLATLQIPESMIFLDEQETLEMNEMIGNFDSGAEIGMVIPADEEQHWYIIFEYFEEGFIKDEEADKIDPAKMLKDFQDADKEYNKEREKYGLELLHTIGWHEEPQYNKEKNQLTWALLLEDEEFEFVNYEVRILGRYGFVTATLVSDTEELETLKPELEALLNGFDFNEGYRYIDFNPATDKIAEYGIAALIAGGVAMKSGLIAVVVVLLKKFWFVLAAIVLAVWKFVFGRKKNEDTESIEPTVENTTDTKTEDLNR
jgi:uncharacterized membrane-anchored protein